MAEFFESLLCVFLWLSGGLLTLWGLWGLLNGKKKGESGEWKSKAVAYERDLEVVRAELRKQKDEVVSLRSSLDVSKAALNEKESLIGDFEQKLAAATALGAGAAVKEEVALKAKNDEIANLKAAIESSKLKLKAVEDQAQIELAAAKNAVPDAKLAEAATALRASLKIKEDEVARLTARVNTLAPLELQIKDRDLKLKNLAAQIGDADKGKDDEIAKLQADLAAAQADLAATDVVKEQELGRLHLLIAKFETSADKVEGEIEGLKRQITERDEQVREYDNKLFDLENKLKEIEAARKVAVGDKEGEAQKFRLRIGELEAIAVGAAATMATAATFKPEQEAQIRDLEAASKLQLGEKNAEVTRLRLRITELEQFADELSGKLTEAETYQLAALKDKDAAIALLHLKAKDLEPLEGKLKAALTAQDAAAQSYATSVAELEKQTARVVMLENEIKESDKKLVNALDAKGDEISVLQTRLNALAADLSQAVAEKDEVANKLQWRIGELEAFVGHRDEEIGKLGWRIKELEGFVGERDEELGRLGWRIKELEGVSNELATRDKRITILEADYLQVVSAKEEDLGKLRWRVGELEALAAQYKNKDSEIADLSSRLAAVGKLNADLAEGYNRLREGEARHRSSAIEKDGEIARLTARIVELGTLCAQAAVNTGEFTQLRLPTLENAAPKVKIAESVVAKPVARTVALPPPKAAKVTVKKAKAAKPATKRKPKLNARQQMEFYRANRPGRGEYDDLKLIYGVGPVLEKLLHKLGIFYFRQVATWKEKDIDFVDEQLDHFKGRIRRENWIESAKEEHLKKYKKKR